MFISGEFEAEGVFFYVYKTEHGKWNVEGREFRTQVVAMAYLNKLVERVRKLKSLLPHERYRIGHSFGQFSLTSDRLGAFRSVPINGNNVKQACKDLDEAVGRVAEELANEIEEMGFGNPFGLRYND